MSDLWAVINDLWAAMSSSWAVINDLRAAINDLRAAMSSLSLPISDSFAPINHFPVSPDCLRVSKNHSPVPASRPRCADFQRERRTRFPLHAVGADARRLKIHNGIRNEFCQRSRE
jgi:hypothetical protein